MKKSLLIAVLFLFSACSTKNPFPDKEICFLLFDFKQDKFVEVINSNRCEERFPAASTFKVALSVMAYDSDVLKNETLPEFKWNGESSPMAPWNKDHNPTSWMRDSVVWVSQILTQNIGTEKIQNYLEDFSYGNQDISAGLKYFWLTPAPFIREPMQNSLKISGYEQVSFLTKLWRGVLKTSAASQIITQTILTQDLSPRGNILQGKTGSGFRDENHEMRLGWFVGHLQVEKLEYIVVLNFSDKHKQPPGTYGEREAKEIAIKLLSEKFLW